MVRKGNLPQAAHYIVKANKNYGFGFNRLHEEALTGKFEGKIPKMSVIKVPHTNKGITPLHCACINPDVSVLRKLYSANPDYSINDEEMRKLTHYAAANIEPDCIEFLVQKGVPVNDKDNENMTPLMIACELGRPRNISVFV